MYLFLGLLFFWLVSKFRAFWWLLLPLGIFLDLWFVAPLGVSGIKLLLVWLVFWAILGETRNKSRLRL